MPGHENVEDDDDEYGYEKNLHGLGNENDQYLVLQLGQQSPSVCGDRISAAA